MRPFPLCGVLGSEIGEISIVDVGAMLEGTPRYQVLRDHYRTWLTGFEPDETQYQRLLAEAQADTDYLPCFLGTGGDATFHIARYPGCSSLYRADPALIDMFTSIGASAGGNFTVQRTLPVRTERLDDVYHRADAHYLKIDVQGGELDVLRGAVETLATTLVLEVEVEFVPLYKEQPLFGDVQCFLRERGFLLHKLIDVAGRCFSPMQFPDNPYVPMSQLLWADAVFVRDFAQLQRLTDRELLITAVILHDVYLSYDLCALLLAIYDERRQSAYRAAYLDRLKSIPDLKFLYMNQRRQP